jgi:hypothetical protein
MGDSRVNAGVKVPPQLKRALQDQAETEDRTLSKLCELLLSWSLKQLYVAGNSLELSKLNVNMPSRSTEARVPPYHSMQGPSAVIKERPAIPGGAEITKILEEGQRGLSRGRKSHHSEKEGKTKDKSG